MKLPGLVYSLDKSGGLCLVHVFKASYEFVLHSVVHWMKFYREILQGISWQAAPASQSWKCHWLSRWTYVTITLNDEQSSAETPNNYLCSLVKPSGPHLALYLQLFIYLADAFIQSSWIQHKNSCVAVVLLKLLTAYSHRNTQFLSTRKSCG